MKDMECRFRKIEDLKTANKSESKSIDSIIFANKIGLLNYG